MLLLATLPACAQIRGAALWSPREVISWGSQLRLHTLPSGRARTLARGDFGEGGCVATFAGDRGIVLQQGQGLGQLVWMHAPRWRPEVIDSGMDTHDCQEADLHGRHGIVVVHRYGQVRFYEPPARRGEPWPYTEIYSFYTASHQGGLLRKDVDDDGRLDLLCGDYWIWNPQSFELGWRLFAIHLWFEKPDSALVRIADFGRGVIEAQAHMDNARLALLEPTADIHQQWTQRPLAEDLHLRRIHGLDTADVDGDGRSDIVAAENAGADSRLILLVNRGEGNFEPRVLAHTAGVVFLRLLSVESTGHPGIVTAGADGVRWRKIENK